ncbi:MAG: hypothetical protein J2O48_05815 [Solirubrobacterales bacterium]|nr:hypothetical protein [Solirubrobacterales bacterium]
MSYLDSLFEELTAAGIRGRLRARVVTEFADHLECDPGADLGAPALVARRFADELGSFRARRAALVSFVALGVAGVAMFVLFLAVNDFQRVWSWPLGWPGLAVGALAGQVALASGSLAMLRAWRLRGARVVSAATVQVLRRRVRLALIGGWITVLACGGEEITDGHLLAVVLMGVSALALLAALPSVFGAARPVSAAPGPRGDLGDDLGPLSFGLEPGAFALLFAGLLAVVVTLFGIVAGDPFDGAARGLADGGACLVGYLLLGGYVGMRRSFTERVAAAK